MTSSLFTYIFTYIAFSILLLAVYISLSSNVMLVTFCLVGVFFLSGLLLCLLGLEFFGLVYIAVYVGAVCIFFILALFLFDLRLSKYTHLKENTYSLPIYFGGLVFFVFFDVVLSCLFYNSFFSSHENTLLNQLSSIVVAVDSTGYTFESPIIPERRELRWWMLQKELLLVDGGPAASALTSLDITASARLVNSDCLPINLFLYNCVLHLTHDFGSFMYNRGPMFVFILTLFLFVALVGSLVIILEKHDDNCLSSDDFTT
jgi:NADH:ubiquinone oxidoreductase subunit 6 (subunit J)